MGKGVDAGGLDVAPATPAATIQPLLTSWRKVDKSGMACAHCHSPDAFDLALFNFPEADVRRRASFHVSDQDADNIVALIRSVRESHRITTPRDPVNDRPFQPGGRVLPGATAAERDFELAKHLRVKLPTLAGAPIADLAAALRAKEELLAYDVRREPLGIPFPRWSEDGFHGSGRGTLNDWLPDVAVLPKPGSEAQLFALHDAYIAAPTPTNLWAIVSFYSGNAQMGALLGATPTGQAAKFISDKQQSMLFAQHLLRMEQANVPLKNKLGTATLMAADYRPVTPFFGVGDAGNNTAPPAVEFAPLTLAALTDGRSAGTGLRAMFTQEVLVPWWTVSWTFQPGHQSIANWPEYFPQSLVGHRSAEQAYITHHYLITTLMQMHRTYTPLMTRNGARAQGSLLRFWHGAGLPGFTNTKRGAVFAGAEHQKLSETFAANVTRMMLWLVAGEAAAACQGDRRFTSNANVDSIDEQIDRWRAGAAQVDAATDGANRLAAQNAYEQLARLRRGCSDAAPAAGSGNGLTVTSLRVVETGATLAAPALGSRLAFPWPAQASGTISVQLAGSIEALFSDRYSFRADHGPNASGPIRIWVNDQLAFESVSGTAARETPVTLVAGTRVSIRIEFERSRGVASPTRIEWESARQMPQLVPTRQLYP
jgi:PA14 domain